MPETQIELVRIDVSYVLELLQISRTTFIETFAAGNSAENIKAYLDSSLTENKLLKELNEVNSQFYFAKHCDKNVGYLKINFGHAQTDLRENNGMEIERIYVLQQFQGQKIGQFLIDKAIEIARKNKMDYLWLGVWTKNTKAISFYDKNNFTQIGSHAFFMGNEEQEDLIMKCVLR